MTILIEAGEGEGRLELEPPTPLSYLRELATERLAMYDTLVQGEPAGPSATAGPAGGLNYAGEPRWDEFACIAGHRRLTAD